MDCLTCSQPMENTQREGVVVDQCPDGHGVWLDATELSNLVNVQEVEHTDAERQAAQAARDTNPEALRSESSRNCPKCGVAMEKVNYDEWSGIVIDSCYDHGVWLDQGELDRIESWMEGSDEALAPLKARLDAERIEAENQIADARAAGANHGPFGSFVSFLAIRRKHDKVDAYLDDHV